METNVPVSELVSLNNVSIVWLVLPRVQIFIADNVLVVKLW